MDDIVERLRSIAGELEADDSHEQLDPGAVLCKEAADEIERLRAELADAIKAIDRLHDERRELMAARSTCAQCAKVCAWP